MSELSSINAPRNSAGRYLYQQDCIFWITAALLLFIYLWTPVLWGNEILQGEITREMIISGSWFRPLLNWQILPGEGGMGYWCNILFTRLLGENSFALRTPAVLSALAALYALRFLGEELFDRKTALLGCWLFLGSAGFLLMGRTAAFDMPGTAAVLLATAWAFHGRGKGSWGFPGYLIFYLFCFSGALFKDILTLFLPGVILLPLMFSEGRWKEHLNMRHILALLTTAVIVLLFIRIPYFFAPLPRSAETSLPEIAFLTGVFRQITASFPSPGEWMEQMYRWWSGLFIYLLPWTLLLPVGLGGLLKRWKELPNRTRLFAASWGAAFLLCAIPGSALQGSILPLSPFILLFSAAGFGSRGVESWNRNLFKCAYYLTIICASFCIGSIICFPLWKAIAQATPPAALVLGPVAAGVLAWWALFMDHRKENSLSFLIGLPHPVASVIVAWTLLSGCAMSVLLPEVRDVFNTEGRFFTALREAEKENEFRSVSFMGVVPGAYLYYSNAQKAVEQTDDLKKLTPGYEGEKFLVFFRDRKEIREAFTEQCKQYGIPEGKPFAAEALSRWSSPDSRNGKYVSYLITLPKERIKKNG